MKNVLRGNLKGIVAFCVLAGSACSPARQEVPPSPPPEEPPAAESRSVTDARMVRPEIAEIERRWRERLEVPQDSRIIGGEPVAPGEHPWAVAILYEKAPNQWRQYCGGTLIAPEWVLTAAHCQIREGDRLLVGTNDISNPSGQDIFGVRDVYNHRNYNAASRHDTDIALLRIDGATGVQPATLLQNDEPTAASEEATVIGWGHTIEGGNASDILRKVDVNFVQRPACAANYRQRNETITENMLCAGADGMDSCQGDSGGGLLVYDSDDDGENFSYRLAGVVSFGYGCARPNYPGVYTKVTNFREWIASTMTGS